MSPERWPVTEPALVPVAEPVAGLAPEPVAGLAPEPVAGLVTGPALVPVAGPTLPGAEPEAVPTAAVDGADSPADSPTADSPITDSPAGDAWLDAIERMERELHGALAQAEPVPWRPPVALGPIPPELHERATRLLEAQLHTIRYLEDVRQSTAKHLAAVKSVPRAEQGPRPVYFDLLG